jgi:hypothetical protein
VGAQRARCLAVAVVEVVLIRVHHHAYVVLHD